jgi:twinkle protein
MKPKDTTLDDIEKKLLGSLRETLTALYPKGRVEGSELVLGDISGESGKSLKINLKTGLWADFSRGQSGRILKLFAYRNGGDFKKGMDEVRQLLKLPPVPASNKFKRPKKDWEDDTDFALKPMRYLMRERKIPRDVLVESGVKATATDYIFTGYDEDRKLCYAQYISRASDGDKKVRFSPGNNQARLCLWGMHSMRDLSTDGSVVITEGVIDALTFRAADIYAVSIPSGVSNTDWIDHSWNWLNQFTTIYLCLDYDEAGQAKIAEIAGRLGIYRCKRVIIVDKDANQCLLNHPDNWSQLLKKALHDAKDFSPGKRVTARDIRSAVDLAISEGPIAEQGELLLGWHFKPTEFNKNPLNFRFRPSEQTIWGGYAGGGKTTLLLQHLAYCMFVLGEKVAIASLEEPVEKVVITIITQALGYFPDPSSKEYAQAFDVINDRLIIFNELGIASLDEVLEFFEYASKKDGVRHCVLDSLMCTDIDIDGDKAAVNQMCKKVIQSTNRVGAHYHIVAHCVKADDESWDTLPTMSSIKGVQEITARAHNVIIVWRNKVKENSIEGLRAKGSVTEMQRKQIEQPDTVIKVCKNRNGKKLGQIKAWFNMDNSRFRADFDESFDRAYVETEDNPPV